MRDHVLRPQALDHRQRFLEARVGLGDVDAEARELVVAIALADAEFEAAQGYRPFATIYSTFLQRAYDQVVHDVAIQSLPVRFAMDRAGLVGADGPTHAGSFDLAYLGCLPNFVIMAASDEAEMVHMVATQVAINDRPSALRYPRGEGRGVGAGRRPRTRVAGSR